MAEKTVKQLQQEYADITEKNRDAYDRLNGIGKYRKRIEGSLYDQYQNALKKGFKEDADRLFRAFQDAQAEYKKTQEAKNALKKELDAAKKAETKAKETEASQKSAKSVYDKAMAGLKQAEATLGGYKGEETYRDAYNKAVQAREAYLKTGATPPELAEPKVAIKTTTDGKTSEGSTTEDPTAGITTYSAAIKFLSDPANKESLIQAQKFLSKFGYKGNVKGEPDASFLTALEKAAKEYASLPEAWRGGSLLNYLKNPLTAASSTSGAGGTTIKSYIVQFDKTQAQAAINNVFQNLLGRDVTSAELKVLSEELIAAQKNNPTKYKITTDAAGNVRNSVQTGGLDVGQLITNLIKNGAKKNGAELLPALKEEYTQVKLQDPTITKLENNKKLYETAMKKAGMDIGAKQKVKETTAYGRGLKELQTQINDYIVNAGGKNTPDEIATFAQNLYNRGYDLSSEVGVSELQNFIKYGPGEDGAYTGKAGNVIADLAATASANGLDLQKNFGSKLQGWLTDINKGEPIDNIKRQIREIAKIGMPDNVKKLIDNGMDLNDIYSPYKSTMASVLELSPDSIQLSDPTLRSAITAQGEVPLYDFERALRKDNRWQYTNQARSEVSNATRQILQDFGFMG